MNLISYDTENWERVCKIIFAHVDAKTCPTFSEAAAYIKVRREQCEGRTWEKNNSIKHRAFVTAPFQWPDRRDVFDYIEMFYNPKRKHARNGMLSPVEFERQQKWKKQGV